MMQRIGWAALLAALVLIAMPGFAADDVTLEGGFVWEREDGNHDGDREMKFKFSGAFEDGKFSGSHGFVTEEGELKPAGTLTLDSAD